MDPALRKAIKAAGVTAVTPAVTIKPYDIPSAEYSLSHLPGNYYRRLCIKVHLIGALVWDYTDTVLDIAKGLRIDQVRRVSTAIREIRRDYDRMTQKHLDTEHIRRLCDLSLLFERISRDHLAKLNYGLLNEIHAHDSDLNREYVMLLDAVLTALTVLDALRLYAGERDREIARVYPYAIHSCLPDHFLRLSILLPQYAGDHYFADSEARSITAKILLNEINSIELYDDKGQV